MSPDAFLPLENGKTYLFAETSRGTKGSITFEKLGTGKSWTIDFWRANEGHEMWNLVNEESGIRLSTWAIGGGVMPIDPPLVLVPGMVKEGEGWSSTATLGKLPGLERGKFPNVRFAMEGAKGSTEIAVDKSSYAARSVDFKVVMDADTSRQQEVKTRLWIVPSAGIVKVEVWRHNSEPAAPDATWERSFR